MKQIYSIVDDAIDFIFPVSSIYTKNDFGFYEFSFHEYIIQKNVLQELREIIVKEQCIDINSRAVQRSTFYKFLKNETVFKSGPLNTTHYVIILIAEIAATCPKLHTFIMNGTRLIIDNFLPAAEALANSTSLQTINIEGTRLYADGPAVARELAKSKTLWHC